MISFSSCNLKVQELAKTYVKSSVDSNKCLKNFSKNMKAYFAAKISAKDFEGFWVCFSNSIAIFSASVEGKETGQFTMKEIFTYISELLDEKPEVTEDLTKQMLLLKQWLVGGNEIVTKEELKQISNILNEMTPHLLKLLKNMEFYNLAIEPDSIESLLSKYSWSQVQVKLKHSGAVFTDVLSYFSTMRSKTNYSYDNLKKVLAQIDLFFGAGKKSTFSKFINKQEKLFNAIKTLLSPENNVNQISSQELQQFLSLFSKVYPLFVQYQLTMQGQSLFQAEKLEYFILWMDRTFTVISNLIEKQPSNTIAYSRLVPVFEVLHSRSVLPFKANEKLLSIFIGKFFTELKDRPNLSGLNSKSLQKIKETVNRWTRAQILLSKNHNSKILKKPWLKKSEKDFKYYDKLLSISKNSIYTFENLGIAHLTSKLTLEKRSPYNLFTHNNILSLVEGIFYAYNVKYAKAVEANQPNKIIFNQELSVKEINALAEDFLVLLNTFGPTIPIKKEEFASLTHILSQFFSYSARGSVVEDQKISCNFYCGTDDMGESIDFVNNRHLVSESLSFTEVYEFFSSLLSALVQSNLELKSITKQCSQNCASFFFDKIKKASGFPILDKYFSTATSAAKEEFFSLLYNNIFKKSQEVTRTNLFLSYSVFNFIESVMLKYDTDSSGVLDKKELVPAEKVFEGLVIKLLEAQDMDTDQASVRQAFHYALTVPFDANFWRKFNFLFNPPSLQGDPLSLARILATIVSEK